MPGRLMRAGSVEPAITDSMRQATYASSSEKLLLHGEQAETIGRFSGNGESRNTRDGT
jgi:hypothetical protein